MIRHLARALLAASPALAADGPPTIPQRDVDVTYRIAGATPDAPPRQQRIRWSAAQAKMRIDPPSPGVYMIGDYRSGTLQVVKPAKQSVLDMGPGSFVTHPNMAMARLGDEQVAGLACTDWQTADNGGQPTVLCLTGDGVMLRASHGDQVLVEASAVTYGAQEAANFAAPDGFHHIAAASP